MRAIKERMKAIGDTPELRKRAEWRRFQWKTYEEMGMRLEDIAEEIV